MYNKNMYIEVNYLSIILAGITATIIGYIWYAPFVFGKIWMNLVNIKQNELKKAQKEMMPFMLISTLFSFITAYVLYHFAYFAHSIYKQNTLTDYLVAAFFIWIGFIMPVQFTEVVFSKKPFKLFILNTSYQLIAIIAMAAILTFF